MPSIWLEFVHLWHPPIIFCLNSFDVLLFEDIFFFKEIQNNTFQAHVAFMSSLLLKLFIGLSVSRIVSVLMLVCLIWLITTVDFLGRPDEVTQYWKWMKIL